MAYKVIDGDGLPLWLEAEGGDGSVEGSPALPRSAFSREILDALLPADTEDTIDVLVLGGETTQLLPPATTRYRTLNIYLMPDPTTDTKVTITSLGNTKWEQQFDDVAVGYNGPVIIQMEPLGDMSINVTGTASVRVLITYYEVPNV